MGVKTVATWSATDYVIFKPQHAECKSVRMHYTDVLALCIANGQVKPQRYGPTPEIQTRELTNHGKAILQQTHLTRECSHGKLVIGKFVLGKDTGRVKVCNGKCMGATGPQCDCPCLGENHGANL